MFDLLLKVNDNKEQRYLSIYLQNNKIFVFYDDFLVGERVVKEYPVTEQMVQKLMR